MYRWNPVYSLTDNLCKLFLNSWIQAPLVFKQRSCLFSLATRLKSRMAPTTWNLGVIGYGSSAKTFHIPFIQSVPELKLYAVVQRQPKPDDDAEKDHPGIKSYRTAEELVKDEGVNVVVITTDPVSHFALAKLALENGKHRMQSLVDSPSLHASYFLADAILVIIQWSARNPLPPPRRKPTSWSRLPKPRTSY